MSHVTTTQPEGTPTWLDMGVPDLEAARRFYGDVLEWEFRDQGPEAGGYHLCLLRGEPVAGVMRAPDEGAAGIRWTVYFATDDCDGAVKRAADAGGGVVHQPMDVMELGRMAIVTDAVGAPLGLWQGRTHIGARLVNEPGALVWNELVTGDADEAREFYRNLFRYTTEPIAGELDYTLLRRPDGHEVGGIHGEPDTVSSYWLSYFEVDDVDSTVRTVQTSGGSLEGDPWNSPYGRMAHVRDPFGAEFRLVRPPDRMPDSV
ncbi:VOC family protein [Actinomadura sp. NPDC047616]|uniref:VOC family protein n=1 Tax=Actinomadura sp. NPDC047616 TaxID=3155914 RepID=UPI00340154CB